MALRSHWCQQTKSPLKLANLICMQSCRLPALLQHSIMIHSTNRCDAWLLLHSPFLPFFAFIPVFSLSLSLCLLFLLSLSCQTGLEDLVLGDLAFLIFSVHLCVSRCGPLCGPHVRTDHSASHCMLMWLYTRVSLCVYVSEIRSATQVFVWIRNTPTLTFKQSVMLLSYNPPTSVTP